MTILVTGSTGTIGSEVIRHLHARRADVRALVRDPGKAKLPDGVVPVVGDMTDVDAMRQALSGVDTLFLLNAVVPDELTQALITMDLAREAGIQRIVYFSVLMGDRFTDVPHFSGKYTVERMIAEEQLPASILRPAYFMQNDLSLKEALSDHAVYPMPVGGRGVAMVDARDVGEVVALELIRREQATEPFPAETIEVCGPEALTGHDLAAIWSEALGRQVNYGGDDLAAFEQMLRRFAPGWMAHDMRMMVRGFQKHGMTAQSGAVTQLETMLGRPLRHYRDFARETVEVWQRG